MFDTEMSLTREDEGSLAVRMSGPLVVAGLGAIYLLSLLMMFSGQILPAIVRVPIVVAVLTFVPGGFVVLLMNERCSIDASQILYAFGTSLLLLMFVGGMTNILLPPLGFEQPLTPVPLAGAVTISVGVLAVASLCFRRRGVMRVRIPPLFEPAPLGFLALPLVTILAVMILNATGSNVLILLVLAVIAVVPIVVIRRIEPAWYALGVWSTALAILYHKSLWQYSGFRGRPHGIKAWKAGRWSPGIIENTPFTSELLPTGLLFPMYAHLSDVFILTEYEVINPFLVSFIPVAVFVTTRRFVDSDVAFLAAALFAFAHPFYLQYPTAGRAASPVIFLSLFGVALSDRSSTPTGRSFLTVAFLMGIVVAHYGTSYLVMFVFSTAVVILFIIDRIDDAHLIYHDKFRSTDAGTSIQNEFKFDGGGRRVSVFSPLLVLYFGTATLAWYMYMRGGWKFQLLVHHIQKNIQQASNQEFGGRTSARIAKNYGTPSIEIAKYIYICIGLLMAIGLLVVFYRRVVRREAVLDDSYFAIAGSMFAIFGLTFIFRNWGGGRPMMITFVFTTVFAVIGIVTLTDRTIGGGGREAMAVILATLFILNSGVASSAVLGGIAASNVPLQPQLSNSEMPEGQYIIHQDTDTAAHIWTVKHGNQQMYSDTFGPRQYDWFRPSLAASTPVGVDYGYDKPTVYNPRTHSITSGYIMILGHNQQLQEYWPVHPRFEPGIPLAEFHLSDRQKIYTNGESAIYTVNASSTSDGN